MKKIQSVNFYSRLFSDTVLKQCGSSYCADDEAAQTVKGMWGTYESLHRDRENLDRGSFDILNVFGLTGGRGLEPEIDLRRGDQLDFKSTRNILTTFDRLPKKTIDENSHEILMSTLKAPQILPLLHVFWSGKPLARDQWDRLTQLEDKLKRLNREFQIVLWSDSASLSQPEFMDTLRAYQASTQLSMIKVLCTEQVISFKSGKATNPHCELWQYAGLEGNASWKSDIARGAIINTFGGWYADHDECSSDLLYEVIQDYYHPQEIDKEETHCRVPSPWAGFMGACAYHRVMEGAYNALATLYQREVGEAKKYRNEQLISNRKWKPGDDRKKRRRNAASYITSPTRSAPKAEAVFPFLLRYFEHFLPETQTAVPMDESQIPEIYRMPIPAMADPVFRTVQVTFPAALAGRVQKLVQSGDRISVVNVPITHTKGALSWLGLTPPDFYDKTLQDQAEHLLTIVMREMAVYVCGVNLERELKPYFEREPRLKLSMELFLKELGYCEHRGVWMERCFASKKEKVASFVDMLWRQRVTLYMIEINRGALDKATFTEEQFRTRVINKPGMSLRADDKVTLPDIGTGRSRTQSVLWFVLANQCGNEAVNYLFKDPKSVTPEDALVLLKERFLVNPVDVSTCEQLALCIAHSKEPWNAIISMAKDSHSGSDSVKDQFAVLCGEFLKAFREQKLTSDERGNLIEYLKTLTDVEKIEILARISGCNEEVPDELNMLLCIPTALLPKIKVLMLTEEGEMDFKRLLTEINRLPDGSWHLAQCLKYFHREALMSMGDVSAYAWNWQTVFEVAPDCMTMSNVAAYFRYSIPHKLGPFADNLMAILAYPNGINMDTPSVETITTRIQSFENPPCDWPLGRGGEEDQRTFWEADVLLSKVRVMKTMFEFSDVDFGPLMAFIERNRGVVMYQDSGRPSRQGSSRTGSRAPSYKEPSDSEPDD